MSELEDRFNRVLENNVNKTYQISHAYDDSGYDKERRWHFNIKALNLLIF